MSTEERQIPESANSAITCQATHSGLLEALLPGLQILLMLLRSCLCPALSLRNLLLQLRLAWSQQPTSYLQTRQVKKLHLFQPAWLIRCLIHRLDQFPALF